MDFVISEAKKNGIKLILSLVNNYENLGGKKQYVDWARSQGQTITSDDDFFTNSVAKGYYKNHIKVDYIIPLSLSNDLAVYYKISNSSWFYFGLINLLIVWQIVGVV